MGTGGGKTSELCHRQPILPLILAWGTLKARARRPVGSGNFADYLNSIKNRSTYVHTIQHFSNWSVPTHPAYVFQYALKNEIVFNTCPCKPSAKLSIPCAHTMGKWPNAGSIVCSVARNRPEQSGTADKKVAYSYQKVAHASGAPAVGCHDGIIVSTSIRSRVVTNTGEMSLAGSAVFCGEPVIAFVSPPFLVKWSTD